jgi:murein DD-endopeptidase MepM/ murein hydrolase activator NlpD
MIFIISNTSYANMNTYKVKWGDSLYSLLSEKFSSQQILAINKEVKKMIPGFTLKAGAVISETDDYMIISPDELTDIKITKTPDDFELDVINYPVSTVNYVVSGEIQSSLVEAVSDQGESIELAFMLASIYEWEIDFFQALRKGDSFRLLVEKRFAKDKFIGYGKILAADFMNQGRLIRSLYYESDQVKGYFKPDGTSLRKGFLKAPLRYSRISSKFSNRRLHPVTQKYKPHHGIDYAAPVGTPVYSTADGRIVEMSYKKYNGYYLKIKHMNGYDTMYLHLSKFNKKFKQGSYVRQGDLIAYVGNTGLSTGPHLDYRIRKDGKYLNPLSFKAPEKKLPAALIPDFQNAVAAFEMKMNDGYASRSRFNILM